MTTIPFVIDNKQHKMADVLNTLLQQHNSHSLDIATAYFNVGGWQLLHKGLEELGNFRLLLGDEPEAGFDLGLREVGVKPVKGLIRDLASSEFLLQHLKNLLDAGMRQVLEELPDGIHSGLMRQGARGVFFYFTAQEKKHRQGAGKGNRQHYWRYIMNFKQLPWPRVGRVGPLLWPLCYWGKP